MKRRIINFIRSRLLEAKEFYANYDQRKYALGWPAIIMGLFQAGTSLMKANENKKPGIPKITESTKEGKELTEQLARQTTDPILENQLADIDQSSSQSVGTLKRSLKNPGQILSGLSQLTSGANKAKRKARSDFAGRKMGREQGLLLGMEEKDAFNYDELSGKCKGQLSFNGCRDN